MNNRTVLSDALYYNIMYVIQHFNVEYNEFDLPFAMNNPTAFASSCCTVSSVCVNKSFILASLENVPYSSVLSKSHNMFLKVIYSRSHYPITSSTTFNYAILSDSILILVFDHTGNSNHCRLLSIDQLQYIYVKITTPYCHAT